MTTLKIQSILDFADISISSATLIALAVCRQPDGYTQVLLDLAGPADPTDPQVLNWRTALEAAGFSVNYTPFDELLPVAIHSRLYRAQPADHLIILDLRTLPAFHLFERLASWANRLDERGQKWGAIEARCTPLDRPRSVDPTTFESKNLLPGAFLLNRTAWTNIGPLDERLADLEAAALDWGWRARAAGFCLFRALDTFFYDPRPVAVDGPVYSLAEATARKLGRAGLYFKYGHPDQANTLLAELKSSQPDNEPSWNSIIPATAQEIAAADWTGLEKLEDWIERADPQRNYGHHLADDEALLPPFVPAAPFIAGHRDEWAGPVVALIERLQPAPARLFDIGGRLPADPQALLIGQGLPYEAIAPGEMAYGIESLVERVESGETVLTLVALPDNPLEQTPAQLLKLLAGQARVILVARNSTHQDLVTRLLSGQPVAPADLTHAYNQAQLLELVETAGWRVSDRADLVREHSALYEPDLLLHQATLAGDAIRYLASVFNPTAQTEFFIWQLEPAGPGSSDLTKMSSADVISSPVENLIQSELTEQPMISVLVRTQGRRNELLTETLYSVLAQGGSYEVVIALQLADESDVTTGPAFRTFLTYLPIALQAKVRVFEVFGVGNALPVNPLLEASRGRYWFFLDDDDLLLGGCFAAVETALPPKGATELILHTHTLRRDNSVYETGYAPNDLAGWPRTFPYATDHLSAYWSQPYRPVYQYFNNEMPPSSYLIPASLIRQTVWRFEPFYDLFNDWEFLTRATTLYKVLTLPVFGSCYNIRNNNSQTIGNTALLDKWKEFYANLVAERQHHPLLLEGRAVREIVQTFQTIEGLRTRLYDTGEELDRVRRNVDQSQADLASVTGELEYVRAQLESVRTHLETELEYVRSHLEDELEARRADLTIARAVIPGHQAEINRLNEALDYQQRVYLAELHNTQHVRDNHRQQLEQFQAYVAQLEARLAGAYGSLSWRVTFPLRLGLRILNRLRGKG